MRRTFRLEDLTDTALINHAASTHNHNLTSALEDLMSVATGLGSLSFLRVQLGDGNTYQVLENKKSVILMKRTAKGKWEPSITFEKDEFRKGFVLFEGALMAKGLFKTEIPHGAVFLSED